jgi:hypothetical protein
MQQWQILAVSGWVEQINARLPSRLELCRYYDTILNTIAAAQQLRRLEKFRASIIHNVFAKVKTNFGTGIEGNPGERS